MLRVHRLQSPVTVLGPFKRAVIWVQGCDLRCPGCLAPYTQVMNGGTKLSIGDLAKWVLEQNDIEGITLSGGEPTVQSEQLVRLIDRVRTARDLGVVCYTGHIYESLQQQSAEGVNALLARIDLLIDGPYVRSKHANLRWRASTNQRLIALTERYRGILENMNEETDTSAGIEFTVVNGILYYAGVPSDADFDQHFTHVIQLHSTGRQP